MHGSLQVIENSVQKIEAILFHLLPNYFHQHPFSPTTIKFAIEDPLPCSEIEFSICNGHHHLAPHDLPFQMGIGIIFITVMPILGDRLMGGKFFEPHLIIVV